MSGVPQPGNCPFCEIVNGDPKSQVERVLYRCVLITPLAPVVEGHKLVIPRQHVASATDHPAVAGLVMEQAAEYVRDHEVGPCNYITSAGREATQTIEHLHLHVIPRRIGDGLALPWTTGAGA